jgi:hypothetical protein
MIFLVSTCKIGGVTSVAGQLNPYQLFVFFDFGSDHDLLLE